MQREGALAREYFWPLSRTGPPGGSCLVVDGTESCNRGPELAVGIYNMPLIGEGERQECKRFQLKTSRL